MVRRGTRLVTGGAFVVIIAVVVIITDKVGEVGDSETHEYSGNEPCKEQKDLEHENSPVVV